MLAAARRQPNPTRHDDAQNVPVSENHDIAVGGPSPRNYPIYPRAHLLWRFAARTSITKDEPARRAFADLFG